MSDEDVRRQFMRLSVNRMDDEWDELYNFQRELRCQHGYTVPNLLRMMELPLRLRTYLYTTKQTPSRKVGTGGKKLRDRLKRLRDEYIANDSDREDVIVTDAERIVEEFYDNEPDGVLECVVSVGCRENENKLVVSALYPNKGEMKEVENEIKEALRKGREVDIEVSFSEFLCGPMGAQVPYKVRHEVENPVCLIRGCSTLLLTYNEYVPLIGLSCKHVFAGAFASNYEIVDGEKKLKKGLRALNIDKDLDVYMCSNDDVVQTELLEENMIGVVIPSDASLVADIALFRPILRQTSPGVTVNYIENISHVRLPLRNEVLDIQPGQEICVNTQFGVKEGEIEEWCEVTRTYKARCKAVKNGDSGAALISNGLIVGLVSMGDNHEIFSVTPIHDIIEHIDSIDA